jgi:NADH-quinone oxidoreductase subunit H
MISYELSLGLSIVAVVLTVGSLNLGQIVAWQADTTWFLFQQPLAFFIFLVASYAETNRLPFDMPEAETELVAGYHTEYSSMKFALFFLAEYSNMIVGSALIVTLFMGGWTLFGLEGLGAGWSVFGLSLAWVPGLAIFGVKLLFFLFAFIWVRWTIPRFRYDQLMTLGWAWFIPLALGNVVLTALALATEEPWVAYVLPLLVVGVGLLVAWLAPGRDTTRGSYTPGQARAPVAPAGQGEANR